MKIIESKDIEIIISIVKEAAKFITSDNINNVTEKGKYDYVTNVDIDIQRFLKEKLLEKYTFYRFIGEENGFYNTDPRIPTWILDPIDGTTNLIHRFNHSAISLGLVFENDSLFGVVYNPFNKDLFCAVKDMGAYLNGKKIKVSNSTELSTSLISIGTTPYDKSEDSVSQRFETFKKVFMECRDIRRTGSAALDICYVATGKIDAFFEDALKPWDYAAATCILEEAGGKISTTTKDRLVYSKNTNILATNGKLHNAMYDIIN